MKNSFPKDFLWGASTASHQIEGFTVNDWTEWEKRIAKRNSREGLRPAVQSLQEQASEPDNYLSESEYSPESFKYWKRDIEVIKGLGLKAYRLSVEWSRVEPEEGNFSKEGISYYKELLRELKQNDIKVVLTCWHWTIPLWLEREGGLLSKNIYKYFKRYVEYLFDNLSEYVDYWLTINEPESFISNYLYGKWPPGRRNPYLYLKTTFEVLVGMHIEGYLAIKEKNRNTQVSLAKSFIHLSTYRENFINNTLVKFTNWYINYSFMDKVKEYIDFIGLNFYFHNKIGVWGLKNDNDKVSDLGWWLQPDKLYEVIKLVYGRYSLPIIITENGLADSKDVYREWWIKESVKAIDKSIREGCKVFGYLHWSLLDNFEWDKGYWPKFGLVSINPKTKERIIKKSGSYYSKIIKENGII